MASQATFECTVCCEEKLVDEKLVITEDAVCTECFTESILPQFEAAIKHEFLYPVRWGSVAISAADFPGYLPDEFLLQWLWKEREYRLPINERVYCKHSTASGEECGAFFGEKLGVGCEVIAECNLCENPTCMSCGEGLLDSTIQHFCTEEEVEIQDPFTGMQRGKDYQLCPKCQTPIDLAAGCNHLMCGCGTSFCYICGVDISQTEMDHYALGMPCPRYNQPGTSAAVYDPVEVEEFDWALDTALFGLAMLRFDLRRPTSRYDEILGVARDALEAGLVLQTLAVEFEDSIEILDRVLEAYTTTADRFPDLITELENLASPEPVNDHLMEAYTLFFSRHEGHLASIENRLDVLWEPVTDVLPPWMDKRLYRKLTWPRSNRHAHSTVNEYYERMMDEAESLLVPLPQQITFHRLAKTIMVLLDRHVAYRAVNDPHMLQQLVQHATEAREIIDDDVRDAEVFGWWSNPHLGLRLAVEVYRSERDAFFKGAARRLRELEGQEGDKRVPA
ncbi:hypothetical protein D0869_01555 [Hortaea werneckii]|uniref:RING-type domain-containing protein n=1 Tax=Hortaea werneckii TaxID=91943 RepID=A0A3M6XCK7_HORWE|nr:hypothetical protein KC355_g10750 [Hortaea werneckii]KAI7165893.1 hypothetical protein KC324_g12309 [Hortaea werneckii]KAI7567556.1 hypothetical protein KC316_g12414 [Hortaea werneckii]KAI7659340.1 hypothetical protein KC318_g10713 [Hortaea werneckii]RMX88537.1 hypothetical protein D0869_01555 [Hortaea werneckii]